MEIDWEQLWIEARKNSFVLSGYQEFGDRAAQNYSDSIKNNDYEHGRQIIDVIKGLIKPVFEVLDVGAGPGSLTIPLARLVKKVVALDPSKEMLKVLEENAVEEGIENIETINKTWQEVDDTEIRERFDLVISSEVLWQFEDVGAQLMRMHAASRKYCCVTLHTGLPDDMNGKLWLKVMNKEYDFRLGHIYIYNILYSKGIYANVNFIVPNSIMEKPVNDTIAYYERLFDRYTELTPGVKEIIRDYILEHAVNGVYRTESKLKEAVMWWEKENKEEKQFKG